MTITPISAYGTAKFIVSATAGQGNYTTIASALAAASSGDDIFIREGVYTENLTLKSGVNLIGWMSGEDALTVEIVGTLTASFDGQCVLKNISFGNNGATNILEMTGANSPRVFLEDCYLEVTADRTAISMSGAQPDKIVHLYRCTGLIQDSAILFNSSSVGTVNIEYSKIIAQMSPASPGTATASAGTIDIKYSTMTPVSTTSTAGIKIQSSFLDGSGTNVTALTANGTGTSTANFLTANSGTASAITVGTGATLTISNSTVSSSNTNAITGAGTLVNAGIAFVGTSSLINTTTQTLKSLGAAEFRGRNINTVPSAGMLGEQLTNSGTSVTIGNGASVSITSITVTPGIWNITGMAFYFFSGGTSSESRLGISTTNNTLPAGNAGQSFASLQITAVVNPTLTLPPMQIAVSTNTTYYLVGYVAAVAGASANGIIYATRIA